jgi:hypothetical protein
MWRVSCALFAWRTMLAGAKGPGNVAHTKQVQGKGPEEVAPDYPG